MFKTNNIKVGTLRYYDEEKGVDVLTPTAFGLFIMTDQTYVNFLENSDQYPIFSNESYEDKLVLVKSMNDILKSGPCWVLENYDFRDVFGKEEIDEDSLLEYIVWSKRFFKDRENIVRERLKRSVNPMAMFRILKNDADNTRELNDFFEQRVHVKQKVKKDW